MSHFRFIPLFVLIAFTFQNCGGFEAASFDFYSYSSQPEFFYDLKLVESEVESDGRKTFKFDVVLTYVRDASQAVQYQFEFSSLNSENICASVSDVAQGDTRHFSMTCRIPADDYSHVRMTLSGPDSAQEQKIFRF